MDPITIAAGISAIGSLFKGITGFLGGSDKQKLEELQAQQDLQEGGVAAGQAVRQGEIVEADGATRAAANGGGFVGSTLGVLQGLADQAQFNARAAVYHAQTAARSARYEGAVAKTDGIDALISGVTQAASSLVGGMAKSSAGAQSTAALKFLGNGASDASAADAAVAF